MDFRHAETQAAEKNCNWRHSIEARQRNHHHKTARNVVSVNNMIHLEPRVSAVTHVTRLEVLDRGHAHTRCY